MRWGPFGPHLTLSLPKQQPPPPSKKTKKTKTRNHKNLNATKPKKGRVMWAGALEAPPHPESSKEQSSPKKLPKNKQKEGFGEVRWPTDQPKPSTRRGKRNQKKKHKHTHTDIHIHTDTHPPKQIRNYEIGTNPINALQWPKADRQLSSSDWPLPSKIINGCFGPSHQKSGILKKVQVPLGNWILAFLQERFVGAPKACVMFWGVFGVPVPETVMTQKFRPKRLGELLYAYRLAKPQF